EQLRIVEILELLDERALAPVRRGLDGAAPRIAGLRRDGAELVILAVEFGADGRVDLVGRERTDVQRDRGKVARRRRAERCLVLPVVLRRPLVGVVALRQLDVEDLARLRLRTRRQRALR